MYSKILRVKVIIGSNSFLNLSYQQRIDFISHKIKSSIANSSFAYRNGPPKPNYKRDSRARAARVSNETYYKLPSFKIQQTSEMYKKFT